MENIIETIRERGKLPYFEIELQKGFMLYCIEATGEKLWAKREPITQAEEESSYIPYVEIDIDENFSVDENLEALYEECTNDLEINGLI